MPGSTKEACDLIPTSDTISTSAVDARYTRFKRATDVLIAGVLLLLLGPLLLVAACIIASDGGPALFWHRRVGRGGVPFWCVKFRTMVPDAENVLRTLLDAKPEARREWERDFKLKKDPRVTRVGRLLRKSSIDELPQLINVLRGEMALVGPRPIVLDEIARYGPDITYYYGCRPGMTGPWQVSGRNDKSYRDRVKMDVEYAKELSIKRDFIILVKTAKIVIRGVGAY